MDIGFFPRYDTLGASSRYRFFMYFERWNSVAPDAEIKLQIRPGMSNEYLRRLYSCNKVGKVQQIKEFMHMLLRALKLPENLIIEYELVPNLPYKYEKILIGNRKYILNFDDNVWEKYRGNPHLQDKFDLLCKNASGVIVANQFLYNKVSALNDNVCFVPTVIDLDKYAMNDVKKFEKFTAVWIGTPITYKYLEAHSSMLKKLFSDPQRELLVVANAALGEKRPLAGVNARYVNWSAQDEVKYLKQSHLGIMPLLDDDFSRGKSAFKLLQYQAAGLPLLASPVGENNVVVKNAVNGFCAANDVEWSEAFERLLNDKELYQRCCTASLAQAYEYSVQKYMPIYKNFILDTFCSRKDLNK